MLFAGFGVSQGRFSLLAITIAGVAGNLVGSWLAYAVGYYGRMELVERHAHKLHIKRAHIAWADRWFSRYGEMTVLLTRMLPIIRTSSPSRPGSRGCLSCASRCSRCSGAFPGSSFSRSWAIRSATTGRGGGTAWATSTTPYWPRPVSRSSIWWCDGCEGAVRRQWHGQDHKPARMIVRSKHPSRMALTPSTSPVWVAKVEIRQPPWRCR